MTKRRLSELKMCPRDTAGRRGQSLVQIGLLLMPVLCSPAPGPVGAVVCFESCAVRGCLDERESLLGAQTRVSRTPKLCSVFPKGKEFIVFP